MQQLGLALFLFCAFVVAYVYVLYPLALIVIGSGSRRSRPTPRPDDSLPSISMLVPAHNEEKSIGSKIENALDLDYPSGKLEITVASDASTDGTDDIIRSYLHRGIHLVRNETQRGKIATLSDLAHASHSDLILITDANALFERDSLRELAAHFADPAVGLATGNKILEASPTTVGEGEATYQSYETLLRRAESTVFAVAFVTGAMTAIRRELFSPIPGHLEFDHVLPLQVVNQGFRVVFAEDARFHEETASSTGAEYRVRVRNATRGFSMVFSMGRYLSFRRHPWFAFHVYSRKILRWLIGLPAIGLFLSNLLLWEIPLFRILLAAQVAFYCAAGLGCAARRQAARHRVFALPFYFCLVNWASLVGFYQAARGQRVAVWGTRR
jgi:cellulose synthase/poly-beta-1,6-N-acetylglucosamine synthase-like glycosyltransferase